MSFCEVTVRFRVCEIRDRDNTQNFVNAERRDKAQITLERHDTTRLAGNISPRTCWRRRQLVCDKLATCYENDSQCGGRSHTSRDDINSGNSLTKDYRPSHG